MGMNLTLHRVTGIMITPAETYHDPVLHGSYQTLLILTENGDFEISLHLVAEHPLLAPTDSRADFLEDSLVEAARQRYLGLSDVTEPLPEPEDELEAA